MRQIQTSPLFRRIATALAIFALTILALSCNDAKPSLEKAPSLPGGAFTLQDLDGKPFHLSDMKGKVVFLYFGYTLCPDACPFTLSKLRRTYEILENDKKLHTLFVTLDPERDSPEKLKKYLAYYDIPVTGLTGSEEEIAKVAKLYQVKYEKVESDSAAGYLMDHTTYTYLIDTEGKLRYRFRHKDSPKHMASVTKLLLGSL